MRLVVVIMVIERVIIAMVWRMIVISDRVPTLHQSPFRGPGGQ